MDHRQLAFLAALARERHFGRAAAACHVTQPTLSARLRGLEEELGVRLIRRGRRYEGLTPEGERVLGHARRILGEFEALRGELAPGAPLTGRLTLGVIPTALGALAEPLATLRATHPRLRVRLRELATPRLAQGLENGELDLVLGYLDAPAMAGFAHRPLHEERPALLASPHHFRLPEAPDWASLGDYPLCLLTPEMHNRQLLAARLQAQGESPGEAPTAPLNESLEPQLEANSIAALLALVGAGLGVGVLPENCLPATASGIRARQLPGPGDRVGLLWRPQRPRSRLLEEVLAAWPASP